ncbi:MAG: tripartite tricarboxylate transporter permease [Deltaproteobacteria bacterium]|nr:tripartite tricarboxylate transporter permease [Deltaproteobacteria bacterium]
MEQVIGAIHHMLTLQGILVFVVGSCTGVIIGLLPGLGQGTALILTLPFAFAMSPFTAFILMASAFGSSTAAGSVTSIMINTPGTVGNLTTMIDGYPMARKGQAGRALGLSGMSSAIGGLIGILVLIASIPLARTLIFAFGSPEYFWSVVLALLVIAIATSGEGVFKGLISGLFGILISFIGFNKTTGNTRYTLDLLYLWDGINIVVLVMGLFAVSELVILQSEGRTIDSTGTGHSNIRQSLTGAWEALRAVKTMFRSSVIGTIIGIIPGIGAATATYVSYASEKMLAKDKSSFGTGNPKGIIASEAANNAKDGGSLLPTLFLGIPGAPEMAILLGGFIIFGLQPGPELVLKHMDLIWIIIFSTTFSNILICLWIIFGGSFLSRITQISISKVFVFVVPLCLSAVYATSDDAWDFITIAIFTAIGISLKRGRYPIAPMIIGWVLGPHTERALYVTLKTGYYNPLAFLSSPLSIILAVVVALLIPALVLIPRLCAPADHNRTAEGIASSHSERKVNRTLLSENFESIVAGVFLTIVTIIFLVGAPAYGLPGLIFPVIVGGLLIILLPLVLLSEGSERFSEKSKVILGPFLGKNEQGQKTKIHKIIIILVWVYLFIGALFVFGSVMADALFVFFFLWRLDKLNLRMAACFSIAVTVMIYLLFVVLFKLELWPGIVPTIIPGIIGGGSLSPLR